MLEVLGGEHLLGRRAIAVTADHAWGVEEPQLEAESPIECHDPGGRLVRQHHRASMAREPLAYSHLVVPGEARLRVRREVHIVRRVRLPGITGLERHVLGMAPK